MFCLFSSKSSLVSTYLDYSKYYLISFLTWIFCLASVSELIDGDVVGPHHGFQIFVQPYIWGLNVSNERSKLLVVWNEHSNPCFLQLYLQLHLIYQSKRCPFVSHCSFLHDGDGSLYIPTSLGKFLSLLLQAIQEKKYLMYDHELLIEVPHGLSKCWYFTKYHCSHFPQVDMCGDCVLCYCPELFNLLSDSL